MEKKINKNKIKYCYGIALCFIIAGMILISPSITGNVIGDLSRESSNVLGGISLLIGFVLGFFAKRVLLLIGILLTFLKKK